MSEYLNFTYTAIYSAADDRENYRIWAARNQEVRDQLPDVFAPMLEIESAYIAVWDEDFETAEALLDNARDLMEQSVIQQFRSNLTASWMMVGIAELYLEAGLPAKARDVLDGILTPFPSNAYAKLVLGRVAIQEGDQDEGLQLISEAVDVWASADAEYVHLQEATAILESS